VLGYILGMLLVAGALVAFRQAYADRILPGIVIGGVDVGGMTPDEARGALSSGLASLEDGAVTVTAGPGSTVIAYADVDRSLDIDGMVARAAAVGRDGTWFHEALTGIRQTIEPVTSRPAFTFDRGRLVDALAMYEARAQLRPIDAAVRRTKSGFITTRAQVGVRVDTTDVSPAIEAALIDPATPAAFTVSADVLTIPPAIGDTDAARASQAGDAIAQDLVLAGKKRSWTIKASKIRTWLTFEGTGPSYGPVIDGERVPAALKKIAKDVKRKPTEARYLRDRAGRVFGVSASALGRKLDREATSQAVLAALLDRRDGNGDGDEKVRIVTARVAPELSTSEATKKAPLMIPIGSWTTYYMVSPHNGNGANISVPTRRLDGIVIKPGRTFDFWNALGEVSFRTGYRLGGAIVGGRTVEGRALAGGICAVSTTLFNAAARGGLDIVTRSPHWYYISRYPLGLDATVSDSQSMRFRNDTKHPILIKGYVGGGSVRFELWSVPNGRTVSWSKPAVSNVVRGYDTVQKTSSLPSGQRKRIEHPVDGKHVVVTRTVRNGDGRVVHRDRFVSNYHRMVGITLVGTG
jgi:vancomycin resistance protein YoaR